MGFPASLVGRQNYLNALSAIGVELEKPNFPVTTTCPFCRQNDLYLFDDVITNGVWLFCNACKAHGDIITFGAQIWNTSLPDTIEKFSDLGAISPQGNERPTAEYVRFSAKLNEAERFWAETESQIWNHGDDVIACRLREFGLRHEVAECFGLVGVAHPDQITSLCSALGRARPLRSREDGAAIVYPFYDLPYRLTGFLIAQYNEAFELRQNFIPISGFKQYRPEAGYFMLNKLIGQPVEQFRGHQFISEDLHWSLRTQAKYVKRSSAFLPLLVSYSGPEAESYGASWASFNNAPRIFHATTTSPALISRACNARGYVSVVQPKQPTAIANLASIRTQTKTWQESLKTTLLAADEINALSFAEKLSVPHDKLSACLNKFEHSFSAGFVERVLAGLASAPAAPHRKWLIVERDNSWWNHIGRPIVNVCPRITKVIQADNGEKVYAGTITTPAGDTYAFSDTASKIEEMGLLAYSDAVLAPHKKLVIYDKLWNARSHMFALQMHPPEIVNVSTRYGWDSHNQVFRFDRYEITNTGDVRHTPPWPRAGSVAFDDPLPIAPLPIRDFLSPSHENSYVWNIVAAVISKLVAPILNLDPAATAVSNQEFKTVLAVTKALCCPVERATAAHKHGARGFFARFLHDIPWPTLVYNTFGDEILSNIVPRHFNCPLIVRLPPPARAVAPGYGWQTLLSTKTRENHDFTVLRHVLPAFIQQALSSRLRTFKRDQNICRQVLRTLHAWLLDTYGAAFNLAHAETLIREPDNAHTAVFEELKNAFSSGKLQVLPHPRRRDQARNYIVQKKEHWWLNRNAVDRYFYMERSVAPHWPAVIDLLQQEGVYIGEQTIHNMNGILLNKDWCRQFWSDNEDVINKETG